MRALSVVLTGAAVLAATAAFLNRPPSPKHGGEIAAALSAEGYESWGAITEQRDGWRVKDARPNGSGERYRLTLRNGTYDVIERTPELAKGTMRDRSYGG